MSATQDLVREYRARFLRHDPGRFARMLTRDEAQARSQKYDDIDGRISDTQLSEQLAGHNSYAVPWETNGLAHILALDIDSGGMSAIQTLIEECQRRQLWAFGQYTPRSGLPDSEQHGYIYIPFADLTNVARLQQLGDELTQSVASQGWKIENRAHGADTRLPMTFHQVNRSWGTLALPDRHRPIDPNPLTALRHLFASYQENPVALLPPAPAPKQPVSKAQLPGAIDIARFNTETDIEQLLVSYGAKRVGKGLYLCPFHDDRRASLGVYIRDGRTVCRCLSTHSGCPLARFGRNDAFNVYCIGEAFPGQPLTEEEALRKLNGIAGDDPPTGGQTPPAAPGGPKFPQTPTPPTAPQIPRHTPTHTTSEAADTPFPTWYRDPTLRAYIKDTGSSGVLLLHKTREKLGENATNREVNAEIERRRGRPYTDRHLRALNRERRTLIAEWQAQTPQQEAVAPTPTPGDFHPSAIYDMELDRANRGGEPQPADTSTQAPAPRKTKPARRRHPKPTKLRALDRKHQRLDRWRGMTIQQLEREYCILQRTARKAKTLSQQYALACQVKELEFELARARGQGLQAMVSAAGEGSGQLEPAGSVSSPPPLLAPLPPVRRRWGIVPGVSGEPLPAPTPRRCMPPDDDPWIQLQHHLLEGAEREGDSERVAFYRTVLHLS